MIANRSIEDDTPDAGEYLGADENVGMGILSMDGNNSEDESRGEDEDPGADENPSEDDEEDDRDSDENSSADNTDYHTAKHEVSRELLESIENFRQKVLEADDEIDYFKRKSEAPAKGLERKAKRMRRDLEKTRDECNTLKEANSKLRRELKETADRDSINEANKHLRLDLGEKKAELRKERDEKAEYHRIKDERTALHRVLIEKTKNCRDLEKKNTELQSELMKMTDNCTDLGKEVAELQHKLDQEVTFSAQAMAMFSKKPEI